MLEGWFNSLEQLCFCIEPRFGFQYPCGNIQPCITSVPGDLTSGYAHEAQTKYSYT